MPEPSQSAPKECFVIAPIGKKDSETRKRADRVLEHVFKVALSPEYRVQRADEISEPGMITPQILQAVQDDDLVLADLTEHNPNVFYELAVRHAIEKPIIHVIDTRWQIPFDVAGFRTIVFDFTDLDSVATAIKEIRGQANEVRKGNWGVTPIKMASVMRRPQGESQQTLLLQEALERIIALRLEMIRDRASLEERLKIQSEVLEMVVRQGPYLANSSSLLGARQSEPGGYTFESNPSANAFRDRATAYIRSVASPSDIQITNSAIPPSEPGPSGPDTTKSDSERAMREAMKRKK